MRSRIPFAALAGVCLLSGCKQPAENEPARPVATERAPEFPALPVAEPALDREALLLAVIQAASHSALGADDRQRQRDLDGKRFALRLRFGCRGAAEQEPEATRVWRFDDKRRVLTFKVAPDLDEEGLPSRLLATPDVEAVEGFWIERPWVLQAACPPAAEAKAQAAEASASASPPKDLPASTPAPAIVVAPRIGIAQVFTETDARTHRRDSRAYQATKTLEEGAVPSSSGYDLVISGRLQRLGDGRVIACQSSVPTHPPTCLISAKFDSVTIEVAGGGETIATWSGA